MGKIRPRFRKVYRIAALGMKTKKQLCPGNGQSYASWKHLLIELVQSHQRLHISEDNAQEIRSSNTILLKEYLMDVQGCN